MCLRSDSTCCVRRGPASTARSLDPGEQPHPGDQGLGLIAYGSGLGPWAQASSFSVSGATWKPSGLDCQAADKMPGEAREGRRRLADQTGHCQQAPKAENQSG